MGLETPFAAQKRLTSDEQASDISVGVLLFETLRLFDSVSFREVVPHIRSDADVEESLIHWHCREIRLAAIENFAWFSH